MSDSRSTSYRSSLRAPRPAERLRRMLAAAVCAAVVASTAQPARAVLDPAVSGQWDPPRKWPAVAVHFILMHTGKAIFFRGDESTPRVQVWDPKTELITTTYPGSDIWCSGHSVLPDGRIFVTGGDTNRTNIFDPVTETWQRGPDMRLRRFYPTNVTQADGRVLIYSGRASGLVDIVESYTPGSDTIDLVPNAIRKMEFYPRIFRLPTGLNVYVGEEPTTATLDPTTGIWSVIGNSKFGNRYEGTAVLLPPGHDKIMIAGGEGGTNTAEILDMSVPNPAWRSTTPMNYAHTHVNAVILPTGKLIVAGGSTLNVEQFDPATETWTVMAPLATKREYHSSAILLPDGRVVWAGTNGNPTREIFSPPYLFRGPRPVVTAAPQSVEYGDTFQVTTPDAGSITSAVFLRPNASTHSWDMEQRYVPLAFQQTAPDTLEIQAPTQPVIAHPGYYLLFLVNGDGIPSVAPFVRLDGAPSTPPGGSVTTTTTAPPAPSTSSTSTTSTVPVSTTSTTLPAGATVVEVQVAAGSDDAEEDPNGIIDLTSSDLELVQDKDNRQIVGMRFAALGVPPGSIIYRAWVQLTVDEVGTEDTTVRVAAEAADSPPTFTTGASNISLRPRTTASVVWGPIPAWPTVNAAGADQRTPDLAEVIQEVVDRPGWLANNALALIVTGTGHRTAKAYEGSRTAAPLLHVEYGAGAPPSTTTSSSTSSTTSSSSTSSSTTSTEPEPSTSTSSTTTTSEPAPESTTSTTEPEPSTTTSTEPEPTTSTSSTTTTTEPAPESTTSTTEPEPTTTSSTSSTTSVPPPTATTTTLPVAPIVVEARVTASADDAEETATKKMKLDNSGIELIRDADDQTVGFRFANLNVPAGATVVRAWVQFTAHKAGTTATSLIVAGEAADHPPTFTTAKGNISSRPRTAATAPWGPVPAWTAKSAGATERTGDLAPIVQEIVGRAGWRTGNALVLIFTGNGKRVAKSFDVAPASAALLHVEYRPGTPPIGSVTTTSTLPPAGTSTTTTLPAGTTTTTTLPPTGTTLEVRVALGSDDAEELASGAVDLASSDLELINDPGAGDQIVGMRFAAVAVPPGATVRRAWIQFAVDETDSGATALRIDGEATDSPPTFTTGTYDLSLRPRTAASTAWNPAPWPTVGAVGADQRTADIAAVVQEIVDRPGWQSGNAIVLFATGAGQRTAEAYEGSKATAPLLHVEF